MNVRSYLGREVVTTTGVVITLMSGVFVSSVLGCAIVSRRRHFKDYVLKLETINDVQSSVIDSQNSILKMIDKYK